MKRRAPNTRHSLRRQSGQSMVEYVAVVCFGILVLTTGVGGNVLVDVMAAIKSNYEGYSYAVSLSEYPDADTLAEVLDLYVDYGLDPADALNMVDFGGYETTFGDSMTVTFPGLDDFPDIDPADLLLDVF